MFRAFLFPGRVRPLEDLVGVGRKVHLHGYLCQLNSAIWFEHGQRLSISTKCLPRDSVGSGHTVREMVVAIVQWCLVAFNRHEPLERLLVFDSRRCFLYHVGCCVSQTRCCTMHDGIRMGHDGLHSHLNSNKHPHPKKNESEGIAGPDAGSRCMVLSCCSLGVV